MTSREVIKRLRAEGWVEVHQVGSHKKFTHPEKGRVTVSVSSQDLASGTPRNIFRQAGWEWR